MENNDLPVWYYAKTGTRLGPITFAELRISAKLGNLRAEDLVWTDGMVAWQRASMIAELFDFPKAPALPIAEINSSPPYYSGPPIPPNITPTAPLALPGLPAGDAIHAGFWRRGAAYWLDFLILLIPCLVLNLIPFVGRLLVLIGGWLYFAFMESSVAQASFGKQVMGIKVTDNAGNRIGFGRATGRYWGKLVSSLILCIGYMLAGWTVRKQALHDLMAECCVVFRAVEPGRPMPSVRPPMPWYGWCLNFIPAAIFVISVIGAIAAPAYRDYTVRSQVAEGFISFYAAKLDVEEFFLTKGSCPSSNSEAGLSPPSEFNNKYVDSVVVGFSGNDTTSCLVVIRFGFSAPTPVEVRYKSIILKSTAAGDHLSWACHSDIPDKYLPSICRG